MALASAKLGFPFGKVCSDAYPMRGVDRLDGVLGHQSSGLSRRGSTRDCELRFNIRSDSDAYDPLLHRVDDDDALTAEAKVSSSRNQPCNRRLVNCFVDPEPCWSPLQPFAISLVVLREIEWVLT